MRHMDRLKVIFLSLVLGSGLGVRAAQPQVGTPINLQADRVYKTTADGDLQLDLYYPTTKLAGAYPLVIYTHGGGWAAGNKNLPRTSSMAQVVRRLTEKGFAVASVNYRLCKKGGTISMRDCVTDCKDAVRYLAKHREEMNLDADRVFVFGDSAGGHLCQMLLLSPPQSFPGAKELLGYPFNMIAGVSWYGPCDFEKTDLFNHNDRKNFRDRFGARILKPDSKPEEKLALYREVSPINYLKKNSPPLLMIQGDGDTTIPVKHAYYMKEKANAIHAPVEIMIIKHAGHNWRKADGSTPIEPTRDELIQRTVDFIAEHLN